MKVEQPTSKILFILRSLLEETKGFSKTWIFDYNGKKHVCSIKKHRKKRTLPQNRLYRAWLNCISEETGNDSDNLHEGYKRKYLKWKKINYPGGLDYYLPGSTTELDTIGFNEYLEKIQSHALEFFNCKLLWPGDKYWDEFIEQYG
jgi:hypothetical protein